MFGPETLYKYGSNGTYVAYNPGSTIVKVGLTPSGVAAHGGVAYVALPEPESQVEAGEEIVSLECALSANEGVASPVSGHVLSPNFGLYQNVGMVMDDPMGEGYFAQLRMTQPEQLESLSDEE